MPVLRARGLERVFASGRMAISAVDLDIHAGESVALMGPNGSGKTTLLRILAGDLRPTRGTLELGGSPGRPARLTGYAPDEAVHFDELTGLENARFFAAAHGATVEATNRLIERFGLLADAQLPAGEYSFGMRRKLLLIQALAHSPALLFLDEPTIGLDPDALAALAAELDGRREHGGIVVIATNDTAAASRAGRIVFLHRGRKVADSTPAELLRLVEGTTRIEVELSTDPSAAPAFPGAVAATRTDRGYLLDSSDGPAPLAEVCSALAGAGAHIRSVHVREPDFADVFRKLTGDPLSAPQAPVPAPSRRPRRRPPWRRA